MKIERTMTIKGKNTVDALEQLANVMREHKDADFHKIDSKTMLVSYMEEEVPQEEPTATVISVKQQAEGSLCKSCPHYQDANEGNRGASVRWGKCGLLMDAAVNGYKPICSMRVDELNEGRKEVEIAENNEHDCQTVYAV